MRRPGKMIPSKARRMWEWWRAHRLVALVQIFSASVERVFRQVKFIVETIGVSALGDTMETRLMSRINDY